MITQNAKLIAQNYSLKPKANLRTRTFDYSKHVIAFLETLPNKRVYWTIADQLLRSATSIGANVIEAKSASSRKDFIKFYDISLKSANETAYWLELLKEATGADKNQIEFLLKEVDELSKMLGASLITLKNKKF